MDADVIRRELPLQTVADNLFHFVRAARRRWCRRAPPSAPLVIGGFGAGERVLRVGLVAVEEMLASSSTSLPFALAARTESRIDARFSSSVVSSATRTW
jgi:hypothetical protein